MSSKNAVLSLGRRWPVINLWVVRWFTPGLHVKRWLVLLMLGMVMISLGIGYALRNFYASGPSLPGFTYDLTLQFVSDMSAPSCSARWA